MHKEDYFKIFEKYFQKDKKFFSVNVGVLEVLRRRGLEKNEDTKQQYFLEGPFLINKEAPLHLIEGEPKNK